MRHPLRPGGLKPDVCWVVFQRDDRGDTPIAVCLDSKKANAIKREDEHRRYIQISPLEDPRPPYERTPSELAEVLKTLREEVKRVTGEQSQTGLPFDRQAVDNALDSIDMALGSFGLDGVELAAQPQSNIPAANKFLGWAQQIDSELEKLGLIRDEANQAGNFQLRNSVAMSIIRLDELSRTIRRGESGNEV